MSDHKRGYVDALTPTQWEELCKFLGMELAAVLALPGPELLKLTYARIDARKRELLFLQLKRSTRANARK